MLSGDINVWGQKSSGKDEMRRYEVLDLGDGGSKDGVKALKFSFFGRKILRLYSVAMGGMMWCYRGVPGIIKFVAFVIYGSGRFRLSARECS